MEEEDYEGYRDDDDDDCNEESGGLILSVGKDGKTSIHKPEDYVELLVTDMDLIQGFIKENQDKFNEYVKKLEEKNKQD